MFRQSSNIATNPLIVRLTQLKQNLYTLQMKNQSMIEYLSVVKSHVDALALSGYIRFTYSAARNPISSMKPIVISYYLAIPPLNQLSSPPPHPITNHPPAIVAAHPSIVLVPSTIPPTRIANLSPTDNPPLHPHAKFATKSFIPSIAASIAPIYNINHYLNKLYSPLPPTPPTKGSLIPAQRLISR